MRVRLSAWAFTFQNGYVHLANSGSTRMGPVYFDNILQQIFEKIHYHPEISSKGI